MSLKMMERLVELETDGKCMVVYGESRGILTIEVEDEKIKMKKAGFYEILSILRKELTVGVKVYKTIDGLKSKHEIAVNGIPVAGERIIQQKQVRGVGENQMLNLYETKDGQVGMEVRGKREKLDIQQRLLVELYANAREIKESIEGYYRQHGGNLQKDEVIISWSKIVNEKLQDKSSEYCLGCRGNEVIHRDDCYRGNNLKFVLHHFPIILKDVLAIRKFWKCAEIEENPYEEQMIKCVDDFLHNNGDRNHTICQKILSNILSL